MIRLMVQEHQYIKKCNTKKAYAIIYSEDDNNMLFLCKKNSEYEFEKHTGIHWFIFPESFHEKMSDNFKLVVKSFQDDALDRVCEHDMAQSNWGKSETCFILRPY